MITKSFRMWVHADPNIIWNVILDSVDNPQKYMPDVEESRVLERFEGGMIKERKIEGYSVEVFDYFEYESGIMREIKTLDAVFIERILVSKKQWEIRRELIDHLACSGSIIVKSVPMSTQNTMAPVNIQFLLELETKDFRADGVVKWGKRMTEDIMEEQRRIKEKAEELEKKV